MSTRRIQAAAIADAVQALCIRANTDLGADVERALAQALLDETHPVARDTLDTILQNIRLARTETLPICQDTGVAVVWIDWGEAVTVEGSLTKAVQEGVRRGYRTGFMRASIVADPFDRQNTDDNTPATLHIRMVEGDALHITVAPKGFGSENMSALRMFTPAATLADAQDFVVETVKKAGAKACPPVIAGVGMGGTAEDACLAAKRALLRPLDAPHPNPVYDAWERETLAAVNALGIGPMGLGGKTSALGVRAEALPTHIAGLPMAVNLCCYVNRHAGLTL